MNKGCCILLKNNSYAQLVDFGKTPASYEVSVLKSDPQNVAQLLLGDTELVTVQATDIAAYQNIDNLDDLQSHRRAWKKIGLRLLRTSAIKEDVFVRVGEQAMVDIGDIDSDDEEDNKKRPRPGMCGYDTDDGFVVPDGTQEFTLADPENSEFVADVHDAVLAFNDWHPAPNTQEHRFRAWMANFEKQITHKDDDEQFKKGKCLDHHHPPAKKQKK